MNALCLAADCEILKWALNCIPIVEFSNGVLKVTNPRDNQVVVEISRESLTFSLDQPHETEISEWRSPAEASLSFKIAGRDYVCGLISRIDEASANHTARLVINGRETWLDFFYPICCKPAIDAVIQEAQSAFHK